MASPKKYRYTREHEWASLDDDVITIGVTDHAQEMLTDIVYVELPEVGRTVDTEEACCVVESVKSVSDVFAPLSGTIVEINEELENSPELINDDAFGDGWIFKLRLDDPEAFGELMTAEEYDEFIDGNEG